MMKSKLKVLFDLIATQPSALGRFHGGGEYAKMIVFKALEKGINNFDCIYNSKLELDNELVHRLKKHNIKCFDVSTTEQIRDFIINNEYHVFYSALPYDYGDLKLKKCKFIMTVHGLRDLECPSDHMQVYYRNGFVSKLKLKIKNLFFRDYSYKKRYNLFLDLFNNKDKCIITVSNHSKYSILSLFPSINNNEINVLHAPIDLFEDLKITTNYNKKYGKYFLLISSNRWIKNNYRAAKALDSLISKGLIKDIKIILLGSEGLNWKSQFVNKESFIFLDYVTKDELTGLFSGAFSFIYPTLNEGFGYPPLNAMKYYVPVLASSHSSVYEICKDACLYFNPYSIKEIENRILNLVYDENLRNSLIMKGNERVKYLYKINSKMFDDLIIEIFG